MDEQNGQVSDSAIAHNARTGEGGDPIRGRVSPDDAGNGAAGGSEKKKMRRNYTEKITSRHEEIKGWLNDSVKITEIARRLCFDRHYVQDYIIDHEDLTEAKWSGLDKIADKMEERLAEIADLRQEYFTNEAGESIPVHDARLVASNLNAVKFWLERMAQRRGWGAKIETNEVGNGGVRIPVIVMGEMSEEDIAEADADCRAATEKALAETPPM